MSCRYFYTPELPCEAIRAHIHGTCSCCGEWAISYHRNRWTHVGEPCAPRCLGKWISLHGEVDAQFVTGRAPEKRAA